MQVTTKVFLKEEDLSNHLPLQEKKETQTKLKSNQGRLYAANLHNKPCITLNGVSPCAYLGSTPLKEFDYKARQSKINALSATQVISDELHEHNSPNFGNLAFDIIASVASDRLPIPKKTAALFAYGAVKHEESSILEAGAGGAAHVAFELGIEHLCETITEAAIEAGIDSAALRAFIPKHSVVWPVLAAHGTRIAMDMAVKRLPAEDSHPFDLDGSYSITDAKIFCGLASIPGKGLEAVHHALQDAIVAGLHKIGVTDKQIESVMDATQAACYTLGQAILELEECGAIIPL